MRVFDLPLGMMCQEGGEAIGYIIGQFMEVDVGKKGTTVGRFLRVKVWIDIRESLMCDFMREDEVESYEVGRT